MAAMLAAGCPARQRIPPLRPALPAEGPLAPVRATGDLLNVAVRSKGAAHGSGRAQRTPARIRATGPGTRGPGTRRSVPGARRSRPGSGLPGGDPQLRVAPGARPAERGDPPG